MSKLKSSRGQKHRDPTPAELRVYFAEHRYRERETHWEPWVIAFANDVCSRVASTNRKAEWQTDLRTWAKRQEARGVSVDESLFEAFGLDELDVRVVCAAVHDTVCKCGSPINPWHLHADDNDEAELQQEDFETFKAGIPYAVVMSRVPDFQRDHGDTLYRKRIEAHLAAVNGDREKQGQQAKPARHSPDFRFVHWFGTDYSFTSQQASCVETLWKPWEHGTPEVSLAYIIETAGLPEHTTRISTIFRDHPAWGTMIVPGATRGTFRLEKHETRT